MHKFELSGECVSDQFCLSVSCSLEEECAVSICSQTLEDKNMQVHKALQVFTNALTNVETYIALLAAQSKFQSTCNQRQLLTQYRHGSNC